MNTHHLAELFDRYRTHGSTAALARVFDETAPALLSVAKRIARERADAEDAVQSTFLVAIERAVSWDRERPLEPWLFGILVRQLQAARRRDARPIDAARLDAERPDDPTVAVERAELVKTVADAVQLLPEKDRAVLEPWLFDELRGTELARRAGVTGSTLRMRLRRGLARLRRALPAGLGATAVVLSAVDRSALAHVKGSVLATAAKSGGAGAAAAAATTAAGAATSFGVKAAAAALLAAAVLGGGALLRARAAKLESEARQASSAAMPAAADRFAASSDATAVAIAPRREPDARGAADDRSGPIATSPTTTVVLTKGAPAAASDSVLSGVVVDAHGDPIEEANVFVYDDEARIGGSMIAMAEATDTDGTFRIEGVDARAVHVVARKNGVGRATKQTVPGTEHLQFVLGVGARFEGRVVDERGNPVPSAAVELADDEARFVDTQKATTDREGRYAFEVVHGRIRFVRATTTDPARFGFTVLDPEDDDSSAPPEIVVRATRRVALTVGARGDSRPIARACVVVRAGGDVLGAAGLDMRGGYLDRLEPFAVSSTTDDAGRVEFKGVPACDALSIAVAASGHAPLVRSFATSADAPLVERLELEPACTVEGVVRRKDGTPLVDAIVSVEEVAPLREMRARPGSLDVLHSILVDAVASPFAFAARTRADGTFTIEDLPPLPACCLRVESDRRAAYAWIDALQAGETRRDVVVTFGAKVRIEGTIVAEDGAAPEKTTLWLQPASETVHPDREGRFAFDLEPHGTATIWAVAPGYVHERCDVAAPLPALSQVAMTLHRGASISGVVVDAQKNPVADARLIVWPAEPTFEERRKTGGWISESNLALTTTRNDGAFEIRGLPDRPLRLVVKADGYADGELTPIDPGSRNLSVTLHPAR